MKREIARKWVKALKSGDYKQGQGRLRDINDNFCCLGVLCNLHAQEHPEVAANQRKKLEYAGSDGYLPNVVAAWAGLQNTTGSFGIGNCLADMNDGADLRYGIRLTFKEIAKVISKNWKAL